MLHTPSDMSSSSPEKIEYALPLMYCQVDQCEGDTMQLVDWNPTETGHIEVFCRCPDCQSPTMWVVDSDEFFAFSMQQRAGIRSLLDDLKKLELRNMEADADLLADIVDLELLREEQLIYPADVINWRKNPDITQ